MCQFQIRKICQLQIRKSVHFKYENKAFLKKRNVSFSNTKNASFSNTRMCHFRNASLLNTKTLQFSNTKNVPFSNMKKRTVFKYKCYLFYIKRHAIADCRKVLFNCLKNLEQKMNDLYMLANSSKEMQITGDKQLTELTSSVEFLTSKFDEIEKERKEKDELINSLQIEVSSLMVEVKNLENKTHGQEQYSRRNCLLIHELNETKTENTGEMALDVISDKLNMKMSQVSIDRSHRLGKRKGQKPRAIIVKFTRYKDRNHVFRNKEFLKGSGILLQKVLL